VGETTGSCDCGVETTSYFFFRIKLELPDAIGSESNTDMLKYGVGLVEENTCDAPPESHTSSLTASVRLWCWLVRFRIRVTARLYATGDRESAEMSALLLVTEAYCNSFCCDKSHGQI
jgi:hypothetical protein